MRYRLLDPRPVAREALFESMPEVVLVLNENDVVVDVNRAACAMLDRRERELLGLPWPQAFTAPEWRAIPHGSHHLVEREWARDGTTTWLEVQRHPLWDGAGRSLGLLVVARDVTARKQFEQDLRAQSYRDRLTGLSNRRYLDDEAARLQASREFPVAVFAFDLDGLKQVNDRYGHAAGDVLLAGDGALPDALLPGWGPRGARGGRRVPGVAARHRRRRGRTDPRAPERRAGAVQQRARTWPCASPPGVSVIADASDWTAGMKRADERLYDAKREAAAGQL